MSLQDGFNGASNNDQVGKEQVNATGGIRKLEQTLRMTKVEIVVALVLTSRCSAAAVKGTAAGPSPPRESHLEDVCWEAVALHRLYPGPCLCGGSQAHPEHAHLAWARNSLAEDLIVDSGVFLPCGAKTCSFL